MLGIEGQMKPLFLSFIYWTLRNEYGPPPSMSAHMVVSVHVGEPVFV